MIFAIGTVSCVNAENLDNATLADCGQEVMADDLHEDICSVGRDCDSVEEIGSQKSVESAVSTIPAEIKISQSGSYYGEKTLKVKVIDENKTALYPIPVSLKFSNGKTATVITKSNGEATYKLPFNPGNYGVVAKIDSNIFKVNNVKLNNIKIKNAPAEIILKKLSTSFRAKKYFLVKVVNSKTKRGIGGVKLLAKVYSKGKVKKIRFNTDLKGIAKFNTAGLDVGLHKIKIREISKGVTAKAKTSKIKVKKAHTTFLDEVGAIYIKEGGDYYITVFNKNTEKPIKGAKLTVKIYDGKKVYKYVVKTGKYDAHIDLSHLGLGTYKVVVKFDGNSRYKKSTGRDYIDVVRSSGNVIF
ncbi:hypothetical protein [Methanobrevibacter sp.]|uniref:hypothetical protein n=1 Tax=Methanobrevibacter sp. TaxID=66852 RepID=UPI00386CF0D4